MKEKDFFSCVSCSTETWLREQTPDCVLLLEGCEAMSAFCMGRASPQLFISDFNKSNLSQKLPRFDSLYNAPPGGKPAGSLSNLWLSEHVMIHLIPAYRWGLELSKPVRTTEMDWRLQRSYTHIAGSVQGYNKLPDSVSWYIHFCEDHISPIQTWGGYRNDKPWLSAKLRQIRRQKETAFNSEDRYRHTDV